MFSSISTWWHNVNHCQFCDRDSETSFESTLFDGTPEAAEDRRLREKLVKSQQIHGYELKDFDADRPVCAECLKSRLFFRCSATGGLFPARLNRIRSFDELPKATLVPLTPYAAVAHYLSPDGFALVLKEVVRITSLLNMGIKRSRRDTVPGQTIVKVIRKLATHRRTASPEEAAIQLDLLTAQVGGNAYVDYFWERHDESWSERVVAGHSDRGNPYYRTKWHRTTDYSATCIAVVVEPAQGRTRSNGSAGPRDRRPPPGTKQMDRAEAMTVLGLEPGFTQEQVRAAFRKLIALNHPDKVAHLSPEIRAVADALTRKINEAHGLLKATGRESGR
ncbi:J domain-containing protein [Roseomonas nepalensis]|uniref:J domain-containing protein n=1 Tax=Muricoccus nepalensis TaxID=1854500 RepID=A0A502G144_9PROT|nr:J domain-containing protein [Roseomonas nepalensis]TPG55485.1 J domain-containing protein [Roseomonas nepalensis]